MSLVSKSGKHIMSENSQLDKKELPTKLYGGDIQEDLNLLKQHLSDGSEKAQEAVKQIIEKFQTQFEKLQEQRKHIKLISLKSPSHSKQSSQRYKSSNQTSKKIVKIVGGIAAISAATLILVNSIGPNTIEEPSSPQIEYSIGIANNDATINVYGTDYEIVPGAITIDCESGEHAMNIDRAYDTSGEIRTGDITPDDYTFYFKLSEEEMESLINANVYEIKSDYCEILGIPLGTKAYGSSQKTDIAGDETILLIIPLDNDIKKLNLSDAHLWYIDTINEYVKKQENSSEYQRLIIGHNVHLRSQPNKYDSSKILTQIPLGSTVQLKGSEDEHWVLVEYEGQEGYVSASYVVNEANLSEAMITTKNGGSLCLRSSASSDSTILFDMPNGSTLKIIQNVNEDWAKVIYGENIGFASRHLLEVQEIPNTNTHENTQPQNTIEITNSDDDRGL